MVGFLHGKKVFLPCHGGGGRKPFSWGEMAESGEIWEETTRCVYFKVQHHNNMQTICTFVLEYN